ncbi:peroxidase family protein [Motilimonas pumila]|uniref:Heme peroxidase n=1 Tax=Motilimonas pumila TaxID=2303987 RepID=A0A418YFP4_9GAMM|nr:peroxidase family protein [Motilimonas pumila]RJG48202.1 heme peroxidase [Motilimonas pumila]
MSFINGLLDTAKHLPGVANMLNKVASNKLAAATQSRPHSYSLWSPLDKLGAAPSDYLTWHTVTDKNFFDLHLPPARAEYVSQLPNNAPTKDFPFGEITTLFERKSGLKQGRSSVFFMFFAQWFTDGFFRSSHIDPRQTTSNHNIDLAQIYGYNEAVALLLRSKHGGKLQSQFIDGEEYPDALGEFDNDGNWQVKERYQTLPYIEDSQWQEQIFGHLNDQQKSHLYATGLERGNTMVGHMAISTLFLREHNNLCDELSQAYPSWDDDRLFHTARIINTVILMKLVIEDYVNHIAGLDVLIMDPTFAEEQRWYRTPWIAAEFNLLYRWHGLVPDYLLMEQGQESLTDNFELLKDRGLSAILAAASKQPAGQISLDNVPSFLLPAEMAMINKGREWCLQPYNVYREKFGLKALTSFEQLTDDREITSKLQSLYGHIDKLELTVGLFAEDGGSKLTGELQTAMVAYDALTQIYTNPLLAKENYTERHFTPVGMKRINATHSFQDLADRNLVGQPQVHVARKA